jgi:DNA-binding transcriptional ArsR family regulator
MERVSEQEQRPGPEPVALRSVASVDMLRAMADPTRLAILSALMERHDDLPVMSVKELAARLRQPQTKLYRHMRQLEAAGLIRVASTRLVSGIVEQRYQASQRDLTFDGGFMREHADESEAAMRALLERFRAGFATAFRDKQLAPGAVPDAEAYRRPTLLLTEARLSPRRAREVWEKLQELQKWLSSVEDEDPEGILVEVLVGYYATPGPDRT